MIALLYEPARKEEDEDLPPERWLYVDKCKDGPAKVSIPLHWDPHCAAFLDMVRPTSEVEPEDHFDDLDRGEDRYP